VSAAARAPRVCGFCYWGEITTMKSKRQDSTAVCVRCPADLKAEIDRRARDDGRRLSNYVIHTLRKHVEATPQPKHKPLTA
jgi:hypothetical protein